MPRRNINDLGNETVMKRGCGFSGIFFIVMKIDLIVRKFEEKGIELSDAQKNAIELLNEYEIDNMNRKSVCPSKIDIKKENWCELRDYIVAAKKEI